MTIPLDSDGYARWECPTCEREFKSRPTPEGEASVPVPDGGYFCPYCGLQAPPGEWLTKAQAELAQSIVLAEAVDPMMVEFADDIGEIGTRSGGLISARVDHQSSEAPVPLTEADDMTMVDFVCHPSEPLKVLDDWTRPARCLICGVPTS